MFSPVRDNVQYFTITAELFENELLRTDLLVGFAKNGAYLAPTG